MMHSHGFQICTLRSGPPGIGETEVRNGVCKTLKHMRKEKSRCRERLKNMKAEKGEPQNRKVKQIRLREMGPSLTWSTCQRGSERKKMF